MTAASATQACVRLFIDGEDMPHPFGGFIVQSIPFLCVAKSRMGKDWVGAFGCFIVKSISFFRVAKSWFWGGGGGGGGVHEQDIPHPFGGCIV